MADAPARKFAVDYQTQDRFTQAHHAPELYQAAHVLDPLPGWDAVGDHQVEQYRELGFLSVADAFDAPTIDTAIRDLVSVIADPPADYTGLQFEASAADRLDELSVDERQNYVRKLMHFKGYVDGLTALGEDEQLLAMVRKLLGDREPKMFQDMALLKPPGGREKPWHQDHAYFALKIGEPVVGVWIALDNATVENGCMHVLPGSHREGPIVHFNRRDWQICDEQIDGDSIAAVPLSPGGLLLFDGLLHHGTPDNLTDQRRRSVQFHFCAADAEWVDDEARRAVFGEEGKDVEC